MTDFRTLMKKGEGMFYDRIRCGKYDMSIQCHRTAYCEPRENGLPLTEYKSMEVAIFDHDSGDWTPIITLKGKIPEDIRQDFECADDSVDTWVNGVLGYASIADIQRLFEALSVAS